MSSEVDGCSNDCGQQRDECLDRIIEYRSGIVNQIRDLIRTNTLYEPHNLFDKAHAAGVFRGISMVYALIDPLKIY